MAGRTPQKAVQNFLRPLQLAMSCVTKTPLSVQGGYRPADQPHILTVNDGSPVRLSGAPPLGLSVIQHYRIVRDTGARGPWKVTTVAYHYAIEEWDGQEILVYHWHPHGRSPIISPHLHLSAGAHIGRDELAIAHLPTGRIALEDVLRLAIVDFGVTPNRSDWAEILNRTQAAYNKWRTW